MNRMLKALQSLVIITLMFALLLSTGLAESSITVDSGSIREVKLIVNFNDPDIIKDEVESIYISIENIESYIENILDEQKTATKKTFFRGNNNIIIGDGFIRFEINAYSDMARSLGASSKEITFKVVRKYKSTLEKKGTIQGIFEESTKSDIKDDYAGYLFKDYLYKSSSEHWAYEHMKHLKSLSIYKGSDLGYAYPEAKVTAEEFIALLGRALKNMGKSTNTSKLNVFNATSMENSWAKEEYMIVMNAYGIISEEITNKGMTELHKVLTGTENIYSYITREEAAIILSSFLGDSTDTTNYWGFKDWSKVNNKGRVARLCEYGVMYGSKESDGLYIVPTKQITRAEAAALIDRFLLIKDDVVIAPQSQTRENYTVNDSTPPIITFNPLDSTTIKPAQEISFRVSESESNILSVNYYWDSNVATKKKNINNKTFTQLLKAPSEAGKYVLTVMAQNAGGRKTLQKATYIVNGTANRGDTTPPIIEAYKTSDNSKLSFYSSFEPGEMINVKAYDNESGISKLVYYWEGQAEQVVNGDNFSFKTPLTNGIYMMYINAYNTLNLSSEQTIKFNIWGSSDSTVTPILVLDGTEITPTIDLNNPITINITPNQAITINGSNPSGITQINYRWDNELIGTTIDGSSININVPTSLGIHYLYIKTKDLYGIWSQERVYVFNVTNDAFEPSNQIKIEVNEREVDIGDDTGVVVEPKDEVTITIGNTKDIIRIGYHWDEEQEKIVEGNHIDVVIPEEEGIHWLYIRTQGKDGVWSGLKKYRFEVIKDKEDIENIRIKEISVKIKDTSNDNIPYSYTYSWSTVESNGQIAIKAPSVKGSYRLYVNLLNTKNNIVEAKDEKFKVTGDEDDGKVIAEIELDSIEFKVFVTENGEAEDIGVTYPGNPDLIGAVNPNLKDFRIEIRNATDNILFKKDEDIKYYIDFYNGSSRSYSKVKIILNLPNGFEGVSASNKGKLCKDEIEWDLGTVDSKEGNRYNAIVQYTGNSEKEFQFMIPVSITVDDKETDNSTIYNMIYKVGAKGDSTHNAYVVGYPDGSFRPSGTITRAEMAAMCANLFNLYGYADSTFYDLSYNHWANSAINACVNNNLMQTSGNYFYPDQPATRATFAIALAKVLEVDDKEPIFINSSDTKNHSAMKAMEQLIRLGLVDGYPDGTAGPDRLVTRAEAVTMLNKYAFRGGLTLPNYSGYGDNTYVFTDLTTGHWAASQILEAALEHTYIRVADGTESLDSY